MKKTTLSFLLCLWAVSALAQTSVMDFYNADIKALSESINESMDKDFPIKKKDVANGFVSYYMPNMGVPQAWKEMAYYTSKNGKKFVATVIFQCVQMCGSISPIPAFCELQNGKLVDKTEQYLPTHVVKQIEKTILEKMSTVIRKVGKEGVNFVTWVKLPQIGTTIQIGVQESNNEQAESYLACELTYNEENGTFTFVKK
jgi:hypothetical protein